MSAAPDGDDDVVGALMENIGALSKQVDWAVDQLTGHPAGGPWCWEGLDDRAEAELWGEVAGFAIWAQSRVLQHVSQSKYAILPCWYRHPDVVEYLTALMVAHKAAYQDQSQKASRALTDFWVRDFWPVMDMIKDRSSMGRCDYRDGHKARDVEATTIDAPEDALLQLMRPPPEGATGG